jgi:opacity protein-like surface antigen
MKTIKFLSLTIFLLIGNYVSGQNSPLSLTVNAGGNLSDMRIKDSDTDSKFGFRGGVGLEMNLSNNFFLQTGLDFAMKGAKSKQMQTGDVNGDGIFGDIYMSDEKMNASYLILPLKAGYRLNLSEAIRINFSLGPYFGYGIGGKYKGKAAFRSGPIVDDNSLTEGTGNVQYEEYSGKTFSSDALKRFDMGVAANVGIEYSRVLLGIGYEYGFFNYSRGSSSSYNNSLFFTLGYRIF